MKYFKKIAILLVLITIVILTFNFFYFNMNNTSNEHDTAIFEANIIKLSKNL